jgi:hypothetical protein
VNGVAVTTPRPTIRVFSLQTQSTRSTVTTNGTWTLAGSPHIVTRYLRVINGATLTIEDGAVVRADAGAGLGAATPTGATLGQTGGLVMQDAGSITLGEHRTPTPGFWRGIEVNSLGRSPRTNVLIEWAGGVRPCRPPAGAAC